MEVEHKLTKPPQHFTDASIIAAMETAGKLVDDEELAEAMRERGLGTPATRAEIIEKLIRTGVVERKARSLMATRRGIDLIDLLETIQLAELVAPDLTGDWEMNLRKIEKGALSDEEFLARIREFTRQMVDKIKAYEVVTQIGVESTEPLGVCPLCGGNVVERPASYACEHHGRKKTDMQVQHPQGDPAEASQQGGSLSADSREENGHAGRVREQARVQVQCSSSADGRQQA